MRDRTERRVSQLPRVRVERIGQQRRDVGRNRSAVDRGRATALVAVARVVQQMEEFAAGPEVVMPLRVVRIREVVVNRVGVLVAVPRDVAVAIAAEPAERQSSARRW